MITCKWFGWWELGQSGGVDVGQAKEKGRSAEFIEVGARRTAQKKQG